MLHTFRCMLAHEDGINWSAKNLPLFDPNSNRDSALFIIYSHNLLSNCEYSLTSEIFLLFTFRSKVDFYMIVFRLVFIYE